MPSALFDDCSLQKGNKSSIVTVLDDVAPSSSQYADRLIVLTALAVADTCAASVLVGEDTGISSC